VIESVLLGIQGDFGEAIYSVTGGGWTFQVPGEYHNHAGFWCGDEYARADFRRWAKARYRTVEKLNAAWGTEIASLDAVEYPVAVIGEGDKARTGPRDDSPGGRRGWLDFVEWYRGAMTDYADWWMAATRKHFPNTEIYLCTGGDAPPAHGSQFAAQCKAAARHGAGVRITNEASDYAVNFAITRWVAAAGRFYGAYFGFEPAGAEDERGIVARIYNATASGALQLHDYAPNVVSSPERLSAQRAHFRYLFRAEPVVDVALWYPNVAMTLRWGGFWEKVTALRDLTDFDYVDELMLRDGALGRYRVLLFVHGNVIEEKDLRRIARWVRAGGVFVTCDFGPRETVEGKPASAAMDFSPGERKLGKGHIISVPHSWPARDDLLAAIGAALRANLPVAPDGEADGVYATVLKDGRLLFLNTTDHPVEKTVRVHGAESKITVKPATITVGDWK
jgi:hypothetical protein